ncbi:MAG: homoserine kinase [Pseudomonadota bacterium]|nr:homoserine kinase [Pseudomonadota bacterium]
MSVYTKITEAELELHLKNYSVGKVLNFSGISEGIENSNYLLTTENGEFIFTIFESIKTPKIEQYLSFMNHMKLNGLLSPLVIKSNDGALFKTIKNKPSAIIEKLDGKSLIHPNSDHCSQLGKVLANFHIHGSNFRPEIENPRSILWVEEALETLEGLIDQNKLSLIKNAIEIQKYFLKIDLPSGMIHADLFRDNILFSKNRISGIIDFYYSCKGMYIYDIAVVVNDWCSQENSTIDYKKLNSLLAEYNKHRKITDNEKNQWKSALVSAALRFYLSRLLDLYFPKIGEITHIKDPTVFENILIDRIESEHQISL